MLENPVVSRALSAAFETRERATRAQELAMSALNLPSAGDLERLTRRLRSVSQRLEAIEDGLDRLEQRIEKLRPPAPWTNVWPRSRRCWPGSRASLAAPAAEQAASGLTPAPLPAQRAQRGLAHPPLGRPQLVLADPDRSGRTRSDTTSSAAASTPRAAGEREQRRGLHLDRERAPAAPSRARAPRSS